QQQQFQWQAPQSHQWQPEWQASPQPMPPQYTPYPGQVPVMAMEPQKSWLATVLLCQFLGTLGVHRFYTGRIISGIFQLLTFGGFGIWTLIDLIMIVSDGFKDQYNRLLNHLHAMGARGSMYTAAFMCFWSSSVTVHGFAT